MMRQPVLSIVVPCYNEEDVLFETKNQLLNILQDLIREKLISQQSTLLFVDDGSKDNTWQQIFAYTEHEKEVAGIKLARNFGHQKALLAGLSAAVHHSDCVISVDADLQDDIHAIREFVLKFLEGNDVVYGVRRNRDTDSSFKRTTAQGFYRFMNKMGIELVYNHADYRLLSQKALLELLRFQESNLFLRGLVPLVGFKSAEVYYDRKERFAGDSKYPLKKMLSFAFDGLTSFSVAPIRLITLLGFLSFFLSTIAGIYAVVEKLTSDVASGWASLMISIWFIGGLLLMSIGLIGEYIGKIYEEVKHRPQFIIESDLYTSNFQESFKIPTSTHR